MSRQRGIRIGIVLLLTLLLACLGIWRLHRPEGRKPVLATTPLTPPAKDLSTALHRLRDQLEWPGLNVQDAAAHLADAQAILNFVKDGVAYMPYRGQWAGAEGALRTRTANSIDKALLLESLLKAKGIMTRIVRADMPANATPYQGKDPVQDFPAIQEVQQFLPHAAQAPVTPTDDSEREAHLQQIRAERDATTAAISDLLARNHAALNLEETPDPKSLGDIAPETDTDWVWVEAKEHVPGKWITLDPMFPSLPRPANPVVGFVPVPSRLSVELAAALPDGREQSIVRWEGGTQEALGHDISLSFLPAISSPQVLETLTDPKQVGLWCPVLQVGPVSQRGAAFALSGALLARRNGAIQLEGDTVLTEAEATGTAHSVPINSLVVTSVDASRYPRVRVRMAVEAQQRPVWSHTLFDARDPDTTAKRLPVTIESASVEQRPLLLLVDTSGSMNDNHRLEMAKQAMKSLVQKLGSAQSVGLIAFSYNVSVVQNPMPLAKTRADLLKKIDALGAGGGTMIMEAIENSIKLAAGPSTIVLLTDGQDNGKTDNPTGYPTRITQTNDALTQAHCTLYPVGIGEADDALLENFARVCGTPYIHAVDPTRLPALYSSMATSLSGGVVTAVQVNPSSRDKPGAAKRLKITLAGFPKPVEAAYQIPLKVASTSPMDRRLILKIQVQEGGQPSPRTYVRPLCTLGPGRDPWSVLATYRLGFSLGPLPRRMIAAREIDERIDLLNMKTVQQGGALPQEFALQRGMASHTAHTMTAVALTLPALAEPGSGCQWRGPTLLLETHRMMKTHKSTARRSTLDFLCTCFGLDAHATRKARITWGATLGALEATLLETKSVNQILLERQDALHVAVGTVNGTSTVDRLSAGGGLIIRSSVHKEVSWVLASSGELYPMLLGESEAKGASAVEIGAEFDRLHSLLQMMGAAGSGTLSMLGMPGSVWTALCTFFDEELKLWCYSSVMLGYVSEAMETGKFDVETSEASAVDCCKLTHRPDDFGKHLVNALAVGYASGLGEDFLGWQINEMNVPPIIASLVSSFFSATDPFPLWRNDFLNEVTTTVSPTPTLSNPVSPASAPSGGPKSGIR